MNNYVATNGTRITSKPVPLALTECATDHFDYDPEQVKLYGIGQFMCLEEPDAYSLQGNYYSQEMDFLEVKLYKC